MASSKSKGQSRSWRLGIPERRVLLIGGDLVMASIALLGSLYVWYSAIEEGVTPTFLEFLLIRPPYWFYLLPFFWVMLLTETYNLRRAANWQRTWAGLASAALIGMGFYTLVYFTSDPGSLPRRGVAAFAIAAFALTMLWRLLYIRVFTSPQFVRRALLVGASRAGLALLKVIQDIKPPPYEVIGFIDDDARKQGREYEGVPVLGTSADINDLVEEEGITDILVAITGRIREEMFEALIDAQEQAVAIVRMPVAYEEMLDRVPIHHLEADWMLRSFVDDARVNQFYDVVKRLIDIIGGLIGVAILLVLSPFIILGTLIDSGFPLTFRQVRAGKGGRPYSIIKFRTMMIDAEKEGDPQLAQEDDARSTAWGRFLRKTRLDEWPQFLNVVYGDMSLVGPRPERPELVQHFEDRIPFYRARLLAKPGITGWAQVNFGYASTIEEMAIKLEHDLYYIKRRSILLDLLIIFRTIATVIGFRGR